MPQAREQYVKPLISQLHYTADVKVTMQSICKDLGSGSGPLAPGCTDQFGGPCSSITAS